MFTIIKIAFGILILAFLSIMFTTFDLASLNLDLPSASFYRNNQVIAGSFAGILLISLVVYFTLDDRSIS